ncbi:MAG: Tn3 family transposase [Acetobacteraceae bacterium]|nr:Tn3 family transposase [Acetobacteraceae bacterium]
MPRRRALTGAQLAGLLALPHDHASLVRYWTLGDEDLAVIGARRRDHNRLGFALQLCALRYPGRPLRPGEAVPPQALRFVAEGIGAAPETIAAYGSRAQTRYEHLDALRGAYGFADVTPVRRRELGAWLLPVALATTSAAAVAATLLDETRRRRLVLPTPSIVEEMVAAAMTAAERHVARQLAGSLPAPQAEALEALLTPAPGAPMSVLAWARQPPGAPGHRALARLVAALERLRAIGLDPACVEGIHPERLRRLAREGGRLTAQHLRALAPLRRRATLVAAVIDTIARLIDDGVGVFDRAVGRMFRRAEIGERDALLRDARAVNDKVRLLARLGTALIKARDGEGDLEAAVADAVGWDRLARSVAEAERLARPDRADLPALAARAWPVLHRLGPLFLDAFQLRAVPAAAGTLRAVEALRDAYASGGRRWPKSLPISFLSPSWREAVQTADGISERRIWEAATLLALRDRLRAGDIWVEGSRQWRAVEDQLIPPALFAAMREAGPLPVAVPATAEAYLAERRATLERRLAEVAAKAAADRLEDVRIAGDALRISPLKAATPEEAEALAERLYGMVPAVRITDLLAEVDRWTDFGAAFTHLHTDLPADNRRVVLTAVLADATNLGLTRMADACAVATYRQLAWTAGWHLREETYRRALAVLVNAQQAQPLAAHFGAADVSSSDGQHFPTAGPGEAVGAVNSHYGHDATTLLYTHVTARHAPFHTVAIPPSGEAAHVIDGLLYHEADLASAVHHTDGGGVSDHVFALAHVLGFRFAPRIPNLAERRLYAFGAAATWPALQPFIAGIVDTKLIAARWEEVLRLAASVRTGRVSASLMLKRLGAYPRQNGLALALREIGRIERTLFSLDWLERPELRRQATAELNKGEARNALARAVCFHRLGRLRDRTAELQQHRASGLALVTAAIALWNTVYLGRAVEALRRRGETVPDALLAHLAPLGWQHVNLTGDYLWAQGAGLDADGFRPLRGGRHALVNAA